MANLDIAKSLFEFILRRGEEFRESIELARANPIELSVIFAGAINLFLGVATMPATSAPAPWVKKFRPSMPFVMGMPPDV